MAQRKAIKRSTGVVAECPLEGDCTCKLDGMEERILCDHYKGTLSDKRGLWVICTYEKK